MNIIGLLSVASLLVVASAQEHSYSFKDYNMRREGSAEAGRVRDTEANASVSFQDGENGWVTAKNCDFSGNDLTFQFGKVATCQKACEENEECTHYSAWALMCWLKSGDSAKATRPGSFYRTSCGYLQDRFQVDGSDNEPSPSSPAPSSAAPSPAPSATPEPSEAPEPSETPEPTEAPEPSSSAPSKTPEPSTEAPTEAPSPVPTTKAPTKAPTPPPTTKAPTEAPTPPPTTKAPTKAPTPPPTTKAPTKAPTPPPTTKAPTKAPTPAKNDGGVDAEACLAAHNKARAEVGVPLVTWDEGLAKKGQEWATHMEKNNFFAHSTPGKNDAQMNNLFSGTSCLDAVNAFYSEKSKLPADRIVRAESYTQYGHYTMMVWRKTTRIGCGRGPTKNIACYYEVPGNMLGQAAY